MDLLPRDKSNLIGTDNATNDMALSSCQDPRDNLIDSCTNIYGPKIFYALCRITFRNKRDQHTVKSFIQLSFIKEFLYNNNQIKLYDIPADLEESYRVFI